VCVMLLACASCYLRVRHVTCVCVMLLACASYYLRVRHVTCVCVMGGGKDFVMGVPYVYTYVYTPKFRQCCASFMSPVYECGVGGEEI